jgi:hypothetical protein
MEDTGKNVPRGKNDIRSAVTNVIYEKVARKWGKYDIKKELVL